MSTASSVVDADLADLLLLDRAQQLDLHRERQIRHFVEKQRAAGGRLKETVAIGLRTRERALAVTEELAFHQVLGDGAAVHRDERELGPRALEVNHPRCEFLAAPRLAIDEHRRLTLRQPVDHPADLLHRR